MAKNSRFKKNKNLTPVKPSSWQKIIKWCSSVYGIVSAIILLPTILLTCGDIREKFFTSDKDKFIQEKYILGLLIPDEVAASTKDIVIKSGDFNQRFNVGFFLQEQDYQPDNIVCDSPRENAFKVKMIIKDNRLFLSAVFRDIETGEVIGEIVRNRWRFLKTGMLNWEQNNYQLEIIDRFKNVMLSLEFKAPNILSIKGFFIGNNFANVISDRFISSCIPLSDKEELKRLAKTISPIIVSDPNRDL